MNVYAYTIILGLLYILTYILTMLIVPYGCGHSVFALGVLFILFILFHRMLDRWEVQVYINSYKSKYWYLRRDAVLMSRTRLLNNEQVREALQNALNDKDERVVLAAAKVLKKTEIIYALTSKDISEIASVLNNENPDIRARGCRTLMNIGPHSFSALPALKELAVNDPDSTVRGYAKQAIARIEPLPYDELAKLLNDFNWIERKYAAEALGYIGPKAMHQIPKLREMTAIDDSPQVRESAKRTISRLENPPAD